MRGEIMYQKHSIILWKKAEDIEKSFDDISQEAFTVYEAMLTFPTPFKPQYLTAKSKKAAMEIQSDYKWFRNELEKNVNKEGKKIFEELGYSLSFFSSKKEDCSCSFSMRVGNKSPQFFNTLVIGVPYLVDVYDIKASDTIYNIFTELVNAFNPYWGCVSNTVLTKQYQSPLIHNGTPSTIHWINYWSPEIIEKIGGLKLSEIFRTSENIKFNNGILRIQDTAINMDNPNDIEYQRNLHRKIFA